MVYANAWCMLMHGVCKPQQVPSTIVIDCKLNQMGMYNSFPNGIPFVVFSSENDESHGKHIIKQCFENINTKTRTLYT